MYLVSLISYQPDFPKEKKTFQSTAYKVLSWLPEYEQHIEEEMKVEVIPHFAGIFHLMSLFLAFLVVPEPACFSSQKVDYAHLFSIPWSELAWN